MDRAGASAVALKDLLEGSKSQFRGATGSLAEHRERRGVRDPLPYDRQRAS